MTRSLVRLFVTLASALLVFLNAAALAEIFTVFTKAMQSEPTNVIAALATLAVVIAVFRFVLRALVYQPPSLFAASSGVAVRKADSPVECDLSLNRRARHEAAHAVVALAVGREGVHADVVIRGVSGGQTRFGFGDSKVANAAFEDMTITSAGHIVDIRGGHFDRGSHADMRLLMEGALLILSSGQKPDGHDGDLTTDSLVLGAKRAAERILEAHADSVDRISDELEQKHAVGDRRLRELLPTPAVHFIVRA